MQLVKGAQAFHSAGETRSIRLGVWNFFNGPDVYPKMLQTLESIYGVPLVRPSKTTTTATKESKALFFSMQEPRQNGAKDTKDMTSSEKVTTRHEKFQRPGIEIEVLTDEESDMKDEEDAMKEMTFWNFYSNKLSVELYFATPPKCFGLSFHAQIVVFPADELPTLENTRRLLEAFLSHSHPKQGKAMCLLCFAHSENVAKDDAIDIWKCNVANPPKHPDMRSQPPLPLARTKQGVTLAQLVARLGLFEVDFSQSVLLCLGNVGSASQLKQVLSELYERIPR